MTVTVDDVKKFAEHQMDVMWHDGSGLATTDMVKFNYHGYCVVNPWMDEKTEHPVNPYKYYGKDRTRHFIQKAKDVITQDRIIAQKFKENRRTSK